MLHRYRRRDISDYCAQAIRCTRRALLSGTLVALVAPFGRAALGDTDAAAAPIDQAVAMIERFHAALVDAAAAAGGLPFTDRRELLAPVVEAAFASDVMARLASGRAWRTIEPDDRQRIISLFAAFTTANYAARLAADPPSFAVIGARADRGERVIVEAEVTAADGSTNALAYVVGRHAGRWQIFDVLGRGRFSELARRRAEFTSILERRGVPGLIDTLKTQIQALAS